ncbi:N-acetyltransferase family protein [Pseudarthrobacter sp. N5]|uniref:GNAT family N-acetyltransferase n=1 Tax=Pseudarthrobacter sp. N5 TaxID=3418416 RepID=UPI003CF48C68
MPYRIRQATPADAEAIVRMHTAAHEECYGHLLPSQFFASRRNSMTERVNQRRPFLDSKDPRLVAHDEAGAVMGVADAGPGRDPDMAGIPELYRIYTLSRTHGSGLGAQLIEAAIGDTPAYLWVLEDNPRARAFYQKSGFSPDGARKLLPPDWSELAEIRMVRP